MPKKLFDFLLWSNPKSSALSEEQIFFDENASLFNEPLIPYNDPSSLFGLIRADILLQSLKNKEHIFHFIGRISSENLREERTREAIFHGLPSFSFKGTEIFVPTFSPQLNERMQKSPWLFKSFPYQALTKDRNLCLHHPFDVYGNLPFSSMFTRLVRLDVRKDRSSVFYHPEFQTLFVIDDQGTLEQEIPLHDEKLRSWPPQDLFRKLDLVMEDYFRLDKEAFLEHLAEYGLVSKAFYEEALENARKRRTKKEKRLKR